MVLSSSVVCQYRDGLSFLFQTSCHCGGRLGNVTAKETKGSSLFTLKSQCESCGMRHSWQNESKMSGQEVSRGDVELTSTMILMYV